MTPVDASKAVAMLMAAYPNARVPDGTVVLYETFLAELDRDRAAQAIRHIIRTSKFMPTIAEIVAACDGQAGGNGGDGEAPYHRRFRPPRERPRMKPREVQEAVDAALKAMEPPPAPEQPTTEEPAP